MELLVITKCDPFWGLFEELETVELVISWYLESGGYIAQCTESNKFILFYAPYLPVLKKLSVTISDMKVMRLYQFFFPDDGSLPPHILENHQVGISRWIYDRVISFFCERLEVPAAAVRGTGARRLYEMTWVWEAPRVEELAAPHPTPGNQLHAARPTLHATEPSDLDTLIIYQLDSMLST